MWPHQLVGKQHSERKCLWSGLTATGSKGQDQSAGPLKQHSAVGIRNGFKFRAVFNQVVIAYSKRNSGKIQLQ